MDDYDTSSEEFALMGEAGMSFRQILASLTTAPAERFGESARPGRIAPGFLADMVVLDEDPSKHVRAFAAGRYTVRDGRLIYEGKATRSPQGAPCAHGRSGTANETTEFAAGKRSGGTSRSRFLRTCFPEVRSLAEAERTVPE
ncbi:MAG: amidohydrolase family protein [Candidatus Sulfotelmatobacter sp.]